MQRKSLISLTLLLVLTLGLSRNTLAQPNAANQNALAGMPDAISTAFTYQGQLKDSNGPITGNCDFRFGLWDALNDGTQISSTLEQINVAVSEGLFTVQLDFGTTAFVGGARWLGTAVRCPAGSGSFTTLTPRQPLTAAPYANIAQIANAAFLAEEAGNADTLDGQHASAFQQHYQNLVVVAKSGGDFTTITDALDSITTARAGNPFTVYVAPGVYTETVTMKPYVDIEGAGELVTRITHAGWVSSTLGTVMGADNAELRFLTVENSGGADFAIAIYNDHVSPRITHVTAIAFSGTVDSIGVDNEYANPTLTDVTASGSGAAFNIGVYNYYSSAIMTNVTASSSGETSLNYGVGNLNGSPTMNYVIASASGGMINYGVSNSHASPTMDNVTANASGGTHSYGVYNQSSSPTMNNVTATVSGGTNNYGVQNQSASSPMMTNVVITAFGATGSSNYGVFNASASSPKMTGVTVTASGGAYNYGVWNDSSSITIQNSVISASGGTNDGIHSTASSSTYTIKIDGSQITGGSSTIYQTSQYTTRVGASQLAGGGAYGGAYVCVASYNGNYVALNGSCQP